MVSLNALTIIVYLKERSLRKQSTYLVIEVCLLFLYLSVKIWPGNQLKLKSGSIILTYVLWCSRWYYKSELQHRQQERQWRTHKLRIWLVERGQLSVLHMRHVRQALLNNNLKLPHLRVWGQLEHITMYLQFPAFNSEVRIAVYSSLSLLHQHCRMQTKRYNGKVVTSRQVTFSLSFPPSPEPNLGFFVCGDKFHKPSQGSPVYRQSF